MDIRFEPGFSLDEALEIIYDNYIDGDIFVKPLAPNVNTDEDSGNECEGRLLDTLIPRQLRANAEIRLINNERIGQTMMMMIMIIQKESPEADVATTTIRLFEEMKSWKTKRLVGRNDFEPRWMNGDDFDKGRRSVFPTPDYSKYELM
ncbi:hypothetical protein JTB14_026667 [Gonioctena quinquepunctata]|nr:hypothetical protein JTB14_026667 [Gonioctena quinquepunctata]